MSCDVNCDVTVEEGGGGATFTAIDAREPFARNSLIGRVFIAISRPRYICGVTAVNRRVAGSSPARGANFYNNLAHSPL